MNRKRQRSKNGFAGNTWRGRVFHRLEKLGDRWYLGSGSKGKWRSERLKKILQNEKYIGDALFQKTYTVDFRSQKWVKNNGIVPQYYEKNSHEPIISCDLYLQVQEEMAGGPTSTVGQKGRNEFIVASMLYQALFTVPNVGIFTAGLHGAIGGKRQIGIWERCR